jgi:hypothetical protein
MRNFMVFKTYYCFQRGVNLCRYASFTVDGVPVCAAILGTALTCYYAGAEHARRGEGCFFYIPKTESAAEVAVYRDLFTAVGLYKLNAVDPQLGRAWLSTLEPIK